MPDSLRRKLQNLGKPITDYIDGPAMEDMEWSAIEEIVDRALVEQSDSASCSNCRERPPERKTTGECGRCYQFRHRTGRQWIKPPEDHGCIRGCPNRTQYIVPATETEPAMRLCALHHQRYRRRGARGWICSNSDCTGFPRTGEIYCKKCLAGGRTTA